MNWLKRYCESDLSVREILAGQFVALLVAEATLVVFAAFTDWSRLPALCIGGACGVALVTALCIVMRRTR